MKTIIVVVAFFAIFVQAKPVPDDEDEQAQVEQLLQHNLGELNANGIEIAPEHADEVKQFVERAFREAHAGGLRALFNPDAEGEIQRLSIYEGAKDFVGGDDEQAKIDVVLQKTLDGLNARGINPSPEDAGEVRQLVQRAFEGAHADGLQALFRPEAEAEVERLLNKMGLGQ